MKTYKWLLIFQEKKIHLRNTPTLTYLACVNFWLQFLSPQINQSIKYKQHRNNLYIVLNLVNYTKG